MSCKAACLESRGRCSTQCPGRDDLVQQTQQACLWAELPQELLQRCLSNSTQQERLKHAALACKAWNAAACAACSTVAASFVQHPGSTWPYLSRAYYTQQWLFKHSQHIVTLQLSAINCTKQLQVSIPFSSMPSLKSMQLHSLEMPHSSWQELSNCNKASAAAAASSCRPNCGLTELVLNNSAGGLQELALVELQGLKRLQLAGWHGTVEELSTALVSSSAILAELSLDSCNISHGHTGKSAAGPVPPAHAQSTLGSLQPTAAAAAAAAAALMPAAGQVGPTSEAERPAMSFEALLAGLPKLEVLEMRMCQVDPTPGNPASSGTTASQAAQVTPALQLLNLRRLYIQYGWDAQLPEALLPLISPNTLTHLDLSASHLSSCCRNRTAVLSQLSQLRQLQHCKLGKNSVDWQQPAAVLGVLHQLKHLTYLSLEPVTRDAAVREAYLTTQQVAARLCRHWPGPGGLLQLKKLEIVTRKPPWVRRPVGCMRSAKAAPDVEGRPHFCDCCVLKPFAVRLTPAEAGVNIQWRLVLYDLAVGNFPLAEGVWIPTSLVARGVPHASAP